MIIPFSPPYIDQAVIDEVIDTLRSNWITSGPKVKRLEEEIVKLTGAQAAVCVNSWSSGALIAMKWFGIKEGDEVIIPAYTYCATALAVLNCGAKPVLVDITDDFTIDSEKIREAITSKTKAIIAVDIAGWPCNYTAIRRILTESAVRNLFIPTTENQEKMGRILLVADAAHSIGSKIDGRSAAKQADLTIFSFHAVKNITTAEGGCICLNLDLQFDNEEEYRYLKIYALNGQNRDAYSKYLGSSWKYDILYQGVKANMPDICAALGLAQIRQYTQSLLPARRRIANNYHEGFKSHKWYIKPPLKDSSRESSYHLYPLRIKDVTEEQRDQIVDGLSTIGISVNVHFIPLPMLSLFKQLGFNIDEFPNSYKQYACEISLPIYPQLTDEQVSYLIKSVIEVVEQNFVEKGCIQVGVAL